MIYSINFTDAADEAIAGYKKSNPIAYKKTLQLLKEIAQHPRTGTGHPEPLTRGNNIRYSRRISKKDRLIYDIYDDTITVFILSAESHYGDK
jgi:toxin YoeB